MILRNLFKTAAVVATVACLGFAAACSDDDPKPEPDNGNELKGVKGVYSYFGDEAKNGNGAFLLAFTTAKVSTDKITGPGDLYQFAIYSKLSTLSTPLPEAGTYTFDKSNTYALNTIAADDSFKATLKSGANVVTEGDEIEFSDATLTLTVTGSKLFAEGSVTLKTGETVTLGRTSFTYFEEEPEPTDLKRDLDLDLGLGTLGSAGDYYQNGTSYYLVDLTIPATGELLHLDLVGPAAPTNTFPSIAGTYTVGTSKEAMSCVIGSLTADEDYAGSHYVNNKTGEVGFLKTGTIEITMEAGYVYTMKIDAQTDLGYKVKGEYVGVLVPIDSEGYKQLTTLTEDHTIDFSNVQKGRLIFYGDLTKNGLGYVVVDLDPEKGSADGLAMALLLADADMRELPEGTYSLSYGMNQSSVFLPGQIQKAEFQPTTFYTYDAQAKGTDVQAPIYAGIIKITNMGGMNFQFDVDCYDDANHHITGSWSGPLVEEPAK